MSLDAMIISHLPDGPTAHFKLSSVKLGKDIKVMTFYHPSLMFSVFVSCICHLMSNLYNL